MVLKEITEAINRDRDIYKSRRDPLEPRELPRALAMAVLHLGVTHVCLSGAEVSLSL